MKHWAMAPLLVLVLLPAIGCSDLLFDDPQNIYDGPPMVEFAPVLPAGVYTRTITFTSSSAATQTTSVRVNYIAPASTGNVSGDIMVDASSTAEDGTHYHFTNGSHYTIAAGSTFVDVPIEVMGSGLATGQSVTLLLELAPGEGFHVSENYKQFTLTLRRTS